MKGEGVPSKTATIIQTKSIMKGEGVPSKTATIQQQAMSL